MDDIISQIKDTLRQVDLDIEIMTETKPDSLAIQKMEFLKERLKFDLVQFERVSAGINDYILANDQFNYYFKEYING